MIHHSILGIRGGGGVNIRGRDYGFVMVFFLGFRDYGFRPLLRLSEFRAHSQSSRSASNNFHMKMDVAVAL